MKWKERMALVATQPTIEHAIKRTEKYIKRLKLKSAELKSMKLYFTKRNIETEGKLLKKLKGTLHASIAA